MRKEVIGEATLWLGDCRDLLDEVYGDYQVLVCDPPYGVNLGEHGGAKDGRTAHVLVKEGYEGYDDTLENFQEIVAPALIKAIDAAERSLIFCSAQGAWFLPPPATIGGVYMAAAQGRCGWGFQSLAHAFMYGSAPDLNKGAKATALRSSESAEKNGHPCPKPIGWMEWAIDLASRVGETVLDPFMGSGTTGVACVVHHRAFIGIEREPKYFDIACRRIEQAYRQRPLFEAEPPRKPEQLGIDA
jgi:hypothetical protein